MYCYMNLASDGCKFATHEVQSTNNQITIRSSFAILRVSCYWEYKAGDFDVTRKLRYMLNFINYSQLTVDFSYMLTLCINRTIDLSISIKEIKCSLVLISRIIANLLFINKSINDSWLGIWRYRIDLFFLVITSTNSKELRYRYLTRELRSFNMTIYLQITRLLFIDYVLAMLVFLIDDYTRTVNDWQIFLIDRNCN